MNTTTGFVCRCCLTLTPRPASPHPDYRGYPVCADCGARRAAPAPTAAVVAAVNQQHRDRIAAAQAAYRERNQ